MKMKKEKVCKSKLTCVYPASKRQAGRQWNFYSTHFSFSLFSLPLQLKPLPWHTL